MNLTPSAIQGYSSEAFPGPGEANGIDILKTMVTRSWRTFDLRTLEVILVERADFWIPSEAHLSVRRE